jgi:hypothetical protein
VAVTLYGPPSDTDWGNLGATVYPAAAAGPQCSTVADTAVAHIHQASTKPDSTSIYGAIWLGGFRPAGSLSKGFRPDPNTITLQMTDAELVGQRPSCMTVSLTHSRALDGVGPIFFGGGATTPTPSARLPLTIGFTARDARLTATPRGVVRVDLVPFAGEGSAVVTLSPVGGGPSLGRGTYDAEPGEQASARVRLTAAARRTLARRKRLVVRIAVTASSPGATTARRSKRALIVPTSSRLR